VDNINSEEEITEEIKGYENIDEFF